MPIVGGTQALGEGSDTGGPAHDSGEYKRLQRHDLSAMLWRRVC